MIKLTLYKSSPFDVFFPQKTHLIEDLYDENTYVSCDEFFNTYSKQLQTTAIKPKNKFASDLFNENTYLYTFLAIVILALTLVVIIYRKYISKLFIKKERSSYNEGIKVGNTLFYFVFSSFLVICSFFIIMNTYDKFFLIDLSYSFLNYLTILYVFLGFFIYKFVANYLANKISEKPAYLYNFKYFQLKINSLVVFLCLIMLITMYQNIDKETLIIVGYTLLSFYLLVSVTMLLKDAYTLKVSFLSFLLHFICVEAIPLLSVLKYLSLNIF